MDVFWFLPTHGDGRFLGTNVANSYVPVNSRS